jgi:uncharacterized repeat protein (TIGR03803 family)
MTFSRNGFPLVFAFRLSSITALFIVAVLLAIVLTASANAQTFKTLFNFDGSHGASSGATLVQARDGKLYGTTYSGGANGKGSIYRITTAGALTTMYSFNGPDGQNPFGALLLGPYGNLVGMTYVGGAYGQQVNGYGTVFSIVPRGTFTTLQSFDGTDGQNPEQAVVLGNDGNYYGTTRLGGAIGDGVVFMMSPSGVITPLHSFDGINDGEWVIAGVAQGADGSFYGTTYTGATNFVGTVFRVSRSGEFSTIHTFAGSDGANSVAAPILGPDGNLYGTTGGGGDNGFGVVYQINTSGSSYSVLHSFDGSDGNGPGQLVLANDGNFYGVSSNGGPENDGVVFQVTRAGVVSVLHTFNGADGQNPYAGLVQHTNGLLYGVTYSGGKNGDGTVFSIDAGLPAFVNPQALSGRVGHSIGILGQGFTGTTAVSFNGVSAAFTVVSDTYLTATVPAGATTGYVKVVTPQETLSSIRRFQVR